MTEFNPVNYSIQENKFLLAHIGEPSIIALQAIRGERLPNPHPKDKNPIHYPDGVIPASVKPVLDEVYERTELEKHKGLAWVGIEAVKDAIRNYLVQAEKWEAGKGRRGAPRFPTMASYDGKNRPHWSGPGADSGKVSTYFDAAGNRHPLTLQLQVDADLAWQPEWALPTDGVVPANPAARVDPKAAIITNNEANRVECLVCGHTESFKPESRSSQNAARARMSKHLRNTTNEVSLHREAHTNEFTS